MVRWSSVISNPAIHLYFEGAQLLSELFLKAPKKYKRMKEKAEKCKFCQAKRCCPSQYGVRTLPQHRRVYSLRSRRRLFFPSPWKNWRPLCRLPSLDMSSEVLLRFTKGTCVFQFLRITWHESIYSCSLTSPQPLPSQSRVFAMHHCQYKIRKECYLLSLAW